MLCGGGQFFGFFFSRSRIFRYGLSHDILNKRQRKREGGAYPMLKGVNRRIKEPEVCRVGAEGEGSPLARLVASPG